ncbi:hypothetical protein GGR90_000209 [Sphingopyxis italica]|uniref:Uncharacterized protein n=1 Tax=Sphingopyxis italica TaxID=1129133 RepID=A0A7X5XQF2_9SPHN|nr:hypothetical protein [Sphingopyxis italica]NJB88057.1 hypothetical protein [Sphingopyxis italica]
MSTLESGSVSERVTISAVVSRIITSSITSAIAMRVTTLPLCEIAA